MAIQIPLEDRTKASLKRNLKAGIKRFGKGFIKTIGIVQPKDDPKLAQIGLSVPRFTELAGFLGTDLNIRDEDISDGSISGEIDILLVAAPNGMKPKEVFAVDQFLMKGGSVVVMSSPYTMTIGQGGLGLAKLEGEFKDWLKHHGLFMEETLVLDMQNKAFPLPVMRKVGGNQVQEVRMIEYPYFADIRSNGFNSENPITANLEQVTMAWSSPISIDEEKNSSRQVIELIRSSEKSWLSDDTEIMPEIDNEGVMPFNRTGDFSSHLLGVATKGEFSSYFSGKESPLTLEEIGETDIITRDVLEKSPTASQIILFSSNDFLRDQTLTIANSAIGSEYRGSMDLIANTIDWALEDAGLLSIRSRGHFNRTLPSMEYSSQLFWEYLNYGLIVMSLLVIALVRTHRKKLKQLRYTTLLAR